ncbi:MAG: hypothetical protein AB7J13_01100 [Pyrinomonadaceae bacterium]
MKTTVLYLGAFFLLFIFATADKTFASSGSADDKSLTGQFISKHLASIGTDDARKGLKSITIVGTTSAVFKGRGEGRADGLVVLASQGEKNMIGMKFANAAYPHEKIGFDGTDFTVGFVRPGEYTVLGQFLRINEKSFRVGILGGTLSTGWALNGYDESVGKLKAKGKSKIDGSELLKYEYSPKRGSDLDITLYFDPVTFRHVRTEYKRVISGGQGISVDQSSRQNETRYRMVEKFSDFAAEKELTLPHTYELYLELMTNAGTTSYTWTMALQHFTFDQDLPKSEFNVAGS